MPLRLKPASPTFRLILEIALFIVTLAVIVFFSFLIDRTTLIICRNDGARGFIERIRSVPLEPWRLSACSCALFIVLVGSSVLRPRLKDGTVLQVFASLFEIAICIALSAVLDFSYRGALFIAIIDTMRYIPRARVKYAVIALCVVAYMATDFEIVSLRFPAFSINDYMDYYHDSMRGLLYGVRNLLISVNETLFIAFMVMEIQSWITENSKILDLNRRLVSATDSLRVANVRLEEYARRSEETARVKERNRLAREIHDILGHSLTGIEVGVKACLEIFWHDPSRVRDQLAKIADLAKSGVEEVRRSVHELKPDVGSRFIESINDLVEGIRGGTGRSIEFEVAGERRSLPPLVEEALYRAIQEGLTNSIRHGEAGRIEIEIRFGAESVELAIRDDGKGCPRLREGFGLRSMRERAEALGGQVLFPRRESGFAALITIPSEEAGDSPLRQSAAHEGTRA
jgi:signal transduction histidine kinase